MGQGKLRLPCACANLRRAARAVTRMYEGEMEEQKVTLTQFTLLQVLERAGEMTQGRLGEQLCMDSTTLTRTLAPMIRKGWVRSAAGEDRRERHLRLGEGGRQRLTAANPAWERAQGHMQEILGQGDWEELQSLLQKVGETVA
jgi:DNA-binding MarR family transcriptional regulator